MKIGFQDAPGSGMEAFRGPDQTRRRMTNQANHHHPASYTRHDRISELPLIPPRWLVGGLLVTALVIAALMIRTRLAIDPANWAVGALLAALGGLSVIRLRTHGAATRHQLRWRDFSESALVMVLICVLGAVGSYAAAAETSGFYDASLARADQMLHFDWLVLYRLVVSHPVLQHLGAAAYGSIFLSPWALLGWMAWHGERARAYEFLTVFWFASVLTLVLFPLFPARGALEFLWHGPISYMPTNGLYQGEIIPALRSHAMTHIELGSVRGLVCAPSFHTVCAVIYMVTAWPIPLLRRMLIPLNATMLLATPVEGTHYLSDMILGALVAFTAIALVRAAGALLRGLGDRRAA